MPQMRAVRSGGSVYARPRRNPSKRRGGSKTFSSDFRTLPSFTRTEKPASPSMRASIATATFRSVGLSAGALMDLALLAERLGGGVEGTEEADEVVGRRAVLGEARGEGRRVRGLRRAEAAEAGAPPGRTERPAPCLRDRAEARLAARDEDTRHALSLAVDAE